MPLHPAYAQVSALLTAVFILIAGNGLSNTLIPLSATAAHFPPLSIGVIASAYFVGMFIGCIAAPRIIARAGHIRAFSAFVAVAKGFFPNSAGRESAVFHSAPPSWSTWSVGRSLPAAAATSRCPAWRFTTTPRAARP